MGSHPAGARPATGRVQELLHHRQGWLGTADYFNYPPFDFHLGQADEQAPEPIDWATIEPQVRPAEIDADTWNALWPVLTAGIGDSWAEYVDTVRKTSERLARRGEPTRDVQEIFEFLARQAAGEPVHTVSGVVRDAETGERIAGAEVIARATDGSWRTQATADANGEFVVEGLTAGTYELFLEGWYLDPALEVETPVYGDVSGLELSALPSVPDLVIGEPPIVSDFTPYAFSDSAGTSHLA